MASNLSQVPFSLRPLWVIDKRLAAHAESGQTGRVLSGLLYRREGWLETDGAEDIPRAQWLNYTDEEGIGIGTGPHGFSPIKSLLRPQLLVSARREYGLFRRDMDLTVDDPDFRGVGVAEWIERIKDAIETREDGVPDPLLEKTIHKPIEFAVRTGNLISDLSWSMVLELPIPQMSICRASRSLPRL